MKTPYTYTVLRYVHDVLTGEFANVGVLIYAPNAEILAVKCTSSYGRMSQFFGSVNGKYLRQLFRHLEDQAGVLQVQLFKTSPSSERPKDAQGVAQLLLPRDDSSLQFANMGAGLTDDPLATVSALYERFVERYVVRAQRSTRLDDDILPILKRSLAERRVYLEPKIITAPDYQHEFPLAWKNGIWNTCDVVSFDLSDQGDMLEKANRWLGRAHTLRESPEPFKLILFLGEPQQDRLRMTFQKAENILNRMPRPFELVRESEAAAFAESVEADVKGHSG